MLRGTCTLHASLGSVTYMRVRCTRAVHTVDQAIDKLMRMDPELGVRIEVALVKLLRRDTRENLYAQALAPHSDVVDKIRYPTLSGIYWYGPISAAALSLHVGLDRTVTSRYASQLVEAGLVRRTPDPTDRRASLLALTEVGRRVVEDIRADLADAIAGTISGWPNGLAAAFAESLERFVVDAPLFDGSTATSGRRAAGNV
jgi:DNA-binding MarR family transcriptional regulator